LPWDVLVEVVLFDLIASTVPDRQDSEVGVARVFLHELNKGSTADLVLVDWSQFSHVTLRCSRRILAPQGPQNSSTRRSRRSQLEHFSFARVGLLTTPANRSYSRHKRCSLSYNSRYAAGASKEGIGIWEANTPDLPSRSVGTDLFASISTTRPASSPANASNVRAICEDCR
jgi:hypothetical protein